MLGSYLENFHLIMFGYFCVGCFCVINLSCVAVSNAYWHADHGSLGFANSMIWTGAVLGMATPVFLANILYGAFGDSLFRTWSFLQGLTLIGALASIIYVILFKKYETYIDIVNGNVNDDNSNKEVEPTIEETSKNSEGQLKSSKTIQRSTKRK